MLALHVPVMTRRGNGDLKHCVNSVNWGVYCQLPAAFQKARVFFLFEHESFVTEMDQETADLERSFC